jgi:SAM-dependent methyltransferase
MTNTTREAAGFFRDAWHVYRDVVDHNYMFHRELSAGTGEVLRERFGTRPCGDASQSLRALEGVRIDAYHGCDLSEAALTQARANLQQRVAHPVLECRDLLATMVGLQGSFDVVFTSFAVHHLGQADKGRFFSEARRLIKGDGLLVLIDVVRDEGDDRSRYLDSYMNHARTHWRALDAADFQLVEDHVRTHDFPETLDTLSRLAADAGFRETRPIGRYTWHAAMAFFG